MPSRQVLAAMHAPSGCSGRLQIAASAHLQHHRQQRQQQWPQGPGRPLQQQQRQRRRVAVAVAAPLARDAAPAASAAQPDQYAMELSTAVDAVRLASRLCEVSACCLA